MPADSPSMIHLPMGSRSEKGLGVLGENGVGEFYDQEMWKGRAVFVRFVWSKLDTKSPHFEQAFSADGGKTWEVNWITNQTKR